jgi:alpha-galactosidase
MLDMVRKYNVNMFKVDGIGFEGNRTQIKMEVEGMFRLMDQLRTEGAEDLFLSLTTGTWPSPYWLQHGDSIWRGMLC